MLHEMAADLDTPVSAFLKLRPAGADFLLESVEQGGALGRCSFIGLGGGRETRLFDDHAIVRDEEGRRRLPYGSDGILGAIRRLAGGPSAPELPFPSPLGGSVGYLAYDFVRHLERLPSTAPDPLGLPVGCFRSASTLLVFDHLRRKMIFASTAPDAADRLARTMDLLRRPLIPPAPGRGAAPAYQGGFTQETFRSAVLRLQQHIRQGDIFQAVLSRRESAPLRADPFDVYRALRILNPSPYLFYLDFGDHRIAGSSPEVHARLEGNRAVVRPIAGTRPRGSDAAADQALERELLADEKERAEHLMLVDLARNDLGRCCATGSVRPGALFAVERYSHVMHIVSQVEGRLAPGRDAIDLLASTFPAGTVSGAPKIRAMQLLDGLEPVRRGPYAGGVGYLSPSGDMDFCIALRTVVEKEGKAHLQAGAGIVLDSDPGREWTETENKLAALKEAVAMAEGGLR